MEKMSSSDAPPMCFDMLKTITDDFSENMKIGIGGYGEVYKGLLNGEEIAVKKLFPIHGIDDEALENEFRNLKKVRHKNVIRMIGYCYEISCRDVEYKGQLIWSQVIERALCFEYMKGGSLAKHISDDSCIHDWRTTYKIITGTCEGLHHLHKGGERKLFHLDLKLENVLLDEELVPKIGDFGLPQLFGSSYTHQISFMRRTIGFMPQEYKDSRGVSPKTDVFSLGVIIFHMMAGKKGYDDYWDARHRPNFSPKIQQEFIESVQEYWKTNMQTSQGYRWDRTDLLGVTTCIQLAMQCVEDERDKRPYVREIMGELKELDSKMEQMLKEDPKPPIHKLFYQGLAEAESMHATELRAMTFEELHRMTDGFSEKQLLGTGGYGRVYKGVLDNGEVIAVKKLYNQPGLVEAGFKNELLNLMRAQHQNIIRLVGYCYEIRDKVVEYQGRFVVADEQEIALCLEYMQGGTLEELLSDELISWEARYRIIKGICQGLKHLHTGSKDPIYHLDLKPANILLDKDLIPKIGDFGLSRLLGSMGTFVTKTNSGTRIYMPPEYTYGLQISSKFDVFSLGIIIIQVIAGAEGYYNFKCVYKSPKEFVEHVTGNWSSRVQANAMSTEALLEVQKCIEMALRCVEDDRAKRPSITEIVEELNMT